MTPESSKKDIEIVKSFNNGSIRIEKQWDVEADRAVEYVNVRGVRIRRRNPEIDRLPGFNHPEKIFKKNTYTGYEGELIEALLMRYRIGQHSLLLGPAGTGKTKAIFFLAYLLNVPIYRVPCTKDMKIKENFLFRYTLDEGGKLKGAHLGPLPTSMQEGGILLVDELSNLNATERQVILEPSEHPHHPDFAKDNPPTLTINDFPGEETTIHAQPGWFLIGTGNPDVEAQAGKTRDEEERDIRRTRPYFTRKLPPDVAVSRAAGRYVKDKRYLPPDTTHREEYQYYDVPFRGIEDDKFNQLVPVITEFFQMAQEILDKEVRSVVKQSPAVYFTEIFDRVLDHFMMFQLKKSAEEEADISPETRLQEMLQSAKLALEFYFANAFREEIEIKAPQIAILQQLGLENDEETKKSFQKLINPVGTGDLERVPVREYIKWRIGLLLRQKFWQKGTEAVRMNIGHRIGEILGLSVKGLQSEEEKRRKAEEARRAEEAEKQRKILEQMEEIKKMMTGGKPDAKAGKNPPGNPPANPPGGPNENIDIMGSLDSRYAECLQTLDYYHIPRKIKGIDKKKYDVPTLKQILDKLSSQPEKLALIQKLRSPKMLLRPIAISTKTLSDALDNEKKNPQKKVNPYNGVNIWNETLKDKEGNIVYRPTEYQKPVTQSDGSKLRTDGGKTKLELLQANQTSFPGWDIVFIDGDTEVPQESISKDAHTLLKEFSKAGYSGMTVDDALILQMDGLRKGIPYNRQKIEYLLGNYLPGSGYIPGSDWYPADSRVRVGGYNPDGSAPDLGARRLVRI